MFLNEQEQYRLKLLKDMLEKIDSNLLQMELCDELLKNQANQDLQPIAKQMTSENDFNRKFQLHLKTQVQKHILLLQGGAVNSITQKQSIIP